MTTYLGIVGLCLDLKTVSVPHLLAHNKLKNTSNYFLNDPAETVIVDDVATSILRTVSCIGVHSPDYTASKLRRNQFSTAVNA